MSEREAAREFGLARKKVRKMLAYAASPWWLRFFARFALLGRAGQDARGFRTEECIRLAKLELLHGARYVLGRANGNPADVTPNAGCLAPEAEQGAGSADRYSRSTMARKRHCCFASTGIVVMTFVAVTARMPRALMRPPDGVWNSTVPRLPAVIGKP